MQRQVFSSFLLVMICLTVLPCFSQNTITSDPIYQNSASILVFTKTEGYRHKSIEKGVSTLTELGLQNGFGVVHTEDASTFNSENLAQYDVIVFLSTTMDILNEQQEDAFKGYINKGGSFMGIHAATDTEYDWPWYGQLVGAYFESHPNDPNVRKAIMEVVNRQHPSTSHLGESWERNDEWYNFKNINPDIQVLIMLDESSYEGGTNGDFHPIAWYHEFDGGRVFYTGGGHTKESFDETDFKQHLLGGLNYCLGRKQEN